MANPAFEEDWKVKWAWRSLFYVVYYFFIYLLGIGSIAWYRSQFNMDTRSSPVLQTRLDSANMRIFPNDFVREADYFRADSANQLDFGNTDQAYYRGDSKEKCPMPVFGCPSGWEKKTLREVFAIEFEEKLKRIEAQIEESKFGNVDVLKPNQTQTYTDNVKEFCGDDGMKYQNDQACFFVSLNLINNWKPVGLNADYKMANGLNTMADQKLDEQLHGATNHNGSNVYFGCRIFHTQGASKSDSQIINYGKEPLPLADSDKYISWMGGQNYIPASYYPRTATTPADIIKMRDAHRHEQHSAWYRPELVMKVDMSKASESLAFECNAYANNIKTPMFSWDAAKQQGNWASKSKFPDLAHQSFVMIHS